MDNNKITNVVKLDLFDIKIIKLLTGKRCRFSESEFDILIKNMNNLNINTLSIQKSIDDSYLCKVNDETIEHYKTIK